MMAGRGADFAAPRLRATLHSLYLPEIKANGHPAEAL